MSDELMRLREIEDHYKEVLQGKERTPQHRERGALEGLVILTWLVLMTMTALVIGIV